jgi:pyrimidine operon attenuation protein/uracil phosphoribosyltransferase
MKFKSVLVDEEVMARTLTRLSFEIVERSETLNNVVLVGIRTRGVPLAKAIKERIAANTSIDLPLGELDITLYRDDLSAIADLPVVSSSQIDFDINGKDVVLVDDVLYTGRTVRAAIDALIALGRPKTIRLAILVDRGHRELPIRADYVGKNIPTSKKEVVCVHCQSVDGCNNIELYELD